MINAGSGESFVYNQRVSLAGGFIDEGSRLCDPVVLQVPPVATHRVTAHSANVVVSAEHGAGETLQNNAESPGRDVEVAGLNPDTIGIRNPARAVVETNVGNEVFAASPIRIEAVGETIEGSDRQMIPLGELTIEKPVSARHNRSYYSCSGVTSHLLIAV